MAVFWKKEVDFSVDTYSPNHIDTVIIKGSRRSGGLQVFMASPT